jgi:hypothetical protein
VVATDGVVSQEVRLVGSLTNVTPIKIPDHTNSLPRSCDWSKQEP